MDEVAGRIAVGIDGRVDTRAAVVWAAHCAVQQGWELLLVRCVPEPTADQSPSDWCLGEGRRVQERAARARLEEARTTALAVTGEVAGLRTATLVSWQPPGPTFDLLARSSALVVLGRGRAHRLAGHDIAPGSLTGHLTAHASCPVAVVPADRPGATGGGGEASGAPSGVVVGFDSSPASRRAVVVAADLLARRTARQDSGDSGRGPGLRIVSVDRHVGRQHRDEADRRLLDLAGVRAATVLAHPQLAVKAVHLDGGLQGGTASSLLLREAATAEALVVGRRGHGALVSAVVGSTCAAVVARSRVPVLVVP